MTNAPRQIFTKDEGRQRIAAAAAEVLDAIAQGRAGREALDQLVVRMGHAGLHFDANAQKVLDEIAELGARAVAAEERMRDLATPTSDVHAWTDALDLCRARVPELREKLLAIH